MAGIVEDDNYVIRGPEPKEPLPVDTLGTMFKEIFINDDPQHPIMIDALTGRTFATRTFLQRVCDLAESFRRYGYGSSTTIGLCSENNLAFFVPVLASLFAGTVLVPISQNYVAEELEHTLGITEPGVVFCSRRTHARFVELRARMGFIKRVVVIDDEEGGAGVESLKEFVAKALTKSVTPEDFRPFDGDPKNQIAVVMCSSGTTGMPKGVMLSHYNVATRLFQSRDPRYLTNNKVVLGLMPFYHSYGLFFTLVSMFNRQITVTMDRFEEDFFLKSIQDYRISVLRITPPLAIFLAKTPKLDKYDLSSLAEVFCAAAPLSGGTEVALEKRLNIKTIQQAYGCTEGTQALTFMNKDVYKPGSCGQVITYMVCKVRDPDTGRSLPSYTVGELCFKGPTVMMGYYRNPEATRESFTTDGWLRTGDLGYYDNEQYFYIVDRLKEVIKYKGYQVAPAELEAILVNNPKVLDAAVVGLPDEMAGELPLAFVVKRKGSDVGEKELQEYVAGKVSPQKRLRGGVIFVDSIPKNPSGKILRKVLKDKLRDFRKQQESKL